MSFIKNYYKKSAESHGVPKWFLQGQKEAWDEARMFDCLRADMEQAAALFRCLYTNTLPDASVCDEKSFRIIQKTLAEKGIDLTETPEAAELGTTFSDEEGRAILEVYSNLCKG